jgi:glycosyltransferase involved in cell wall biosynthesis
LLPLESGLATVGIGGDAGIGYHSGLTTRFRFRVDAMDGLSPAVPQQLPARPHAGTKACEVTILLPAYNEELAIQRVLHEIVAALDDEPIAFEILIVDDASTDRTVAYARRFAEECRRCEVRFICRPENRGAGAARKVGVREARGDIVVMLDADGSYPAYAIRDLLRYFPDYDQVNGARTSEQGTMPLLRKPAKWLIRKLACYLTGRDIPDLNTGLKAFKREAMLPWLWSVPDGFSCVTTMTLAFLTNGYAVKYVPTEYRPRIGKSKFHPIKDTLAYLNTVVRIISYFRPLRIFFPTAAVVLGLGAAKSLHSFMTTGSMQESDIVVLMAGFLTMMFGLLAEIVVAHHRR